MIRSMTGYGKCTETRNGREIMVELKSVNHRFFEYSARIPRAYGFLEERLKKLLQQKIARGKVEVGVTIVNVESKDAEITVNEPLARGYIEALRTLSQPLNLTDDLRLSTLCRFSDVFTVTRTETDEEALWADVSVVAGGALEAFLCMRQREGESLKADVLERCTAVERLVEQIEERSPQRVAEYRERLRRKLEEVLASSAIDEARILTEAAIFADKTAVDEETSRLHSHIAQLHEILALSEPVGKKLDFLVQEFNREANTIGSKCQDTEGVRCVVALKSEIEKIREQIQNIE